MNPALASSAHWDGKSKLTNDGLRTRSEPRRPCASSLAGPRSAATPTNSGGPNFCLSSTNAPHSWPASPPSSPALPCVARATSSLCIDESLGDRVPQPPPGPAVPPGMILAQVGGEEGNREAAAPSLLPAGHPHACYRWLPASHPVAASGSCISSAGRSMGQGSPSSRQQSQFRGWTWHSSRQHGVEPR